MPPALKVCSGGGVKIVMIVTPSPDIQSCADIFIELNIDLRFPFVLTLLIGFSSWFGAADKTSFLVFSAHKNRQFHRFIRSPIIGWTCSNSDPVACNAEVCYEGKMMSAVGAN